MTATSPGGNSTEQRAARDPAQRGRGGRRDAQEHPAAPGWPGRYLVAAGWFLHGVWDFAHLRAGTVVSRSYAEWCGSSTS